MAPDAMISATMYEIDRCKVAIDRMSARLNHGLKVFNDISLEKPKLIPAELGLLRAVSWFYGLYFEAGAANVQFLNQLIISYNLDTSKTLSNHLNLVNQLRTYFHHNLDPSKPRDRSIQDYCEEWFRKQCGTSQPDSEDEWLSCLDAFIKEVREYFQALLKCTRLIERDESKNRILQDWEFSRTREHPPETFDRIISITVSDMGREHLDTLSFRKRFYERWKKELATLKGNYDFEIEARKLIEYTLLSETFVVLPITGKDILKTFTQIQPGPKVGELLRKAKIIYEREPCTGDELLEKLKPDIDTL